MSVQHSTSHWPGYYCLLATAGIHFCNSPVALHRFYENFACGSDNGACLPAKQAPSKQQLLFFLLPPQFIVCCKSSSPGSHQPIASSSSMINHISRSWSRVSCRKSLATRCQGSFIIVER